MAKVKPLNDTQIKNFKPTGKSGGDWLPDGDRLYLVVTPTGKKSGNFVILHLSKKTKIPTPLVITLRFHLLKQEELELNAKNY